MSLRDLEWFDLDATHGLWTGRVPPGVALTAQEFDQCWAMHPAGFHTIKMHGRLVRTPRWQQAYGRDYLYSGRVNAALPIPPLLARILHWGKGAIDPRFNGILVNWYDGALGHYIGRHRDSTTNMVAGAPITTISSGEQRTFRLRPWRGSGYRDFDLADGSVLVMPYDTNLAWTHEVPPSARRKGRRISITLRAFES
jgi:alkylated DNA repair dioxygenase AlkB